jgi:hypothetical protein
VIARRRRSELTLRVGSDGRAKSREELARRLARDLLVMLTALAFGPASRAFTLRRTATALLIGAALRRERVRILGAPCRLQAGELRDGERLSDAAPVLPRGAFCGDQRLVVARLRDRRLRGHERERAGEVGPRREQVLRARADAARVAAVAPLDRVPIGVLRLERSRGASRRVPLADRERDRLGVMPEIEVRGSAHLPVLRRHLDDVAALDPEPRGGLRMDLDPRAPEHLGDRIGQLLQPRLVGAPTVAEDRRQIRDEDRSRRARRRWAARPAPGTTATGAGAVRGAMVPVPETLRHGGRECRHAAGKREISQLR